MNSQHIYRNTNANLTRILNFWYWKALEGSLYQKYEKELWEDKFICLLGTKVPTGFNIELKHHGRELYEAFTDLTA